MMKRAINLGAFFVIIIAIVVCLSFTTSAGYYGDYEYEILDDGTVAINNYYGESTTLVIPKKIENRSVTSIGGFDNCSKLVSLTIPNGVKYIDNQAFDNCSALSEIKLPNSIIKIGYNAFDDCRSIDKVYISNLKCWLGIEFEIADWMYSSSSNPLSYGADLYCNNKLVKDLVIPKGTKYINHLSFKGCESITNVKLPEGIVSIGMSAFSDCKNLKQVNIPKTLKKVELHAFSDCSSGINVYIEDIESWLSISYGYGGYYYYSGSNPLSSDGNLYLNNRLVEHIDIPSNFETINCLAFEGCESITSIFIPMSITTIEGDAFIGCTNLKKVYYEGTKEQWEKISMVLDSPLDSATIEYEQMHHFKLETNQKVSCTIDGIKIYVCAYGSSYEEKIKALGHTGGKATCTSKAKCSRCQQYYGDFNHTYKTTTTKATLTKNGKTVTKCSVCGTVKSTSIIYYPKSIKLSATSYTYNGKTKTPSVAVKDSKGKALKKGTDYTVTYPKKRKSIGKYTVTVKFKGKYSGTKKLTFEIVPAKVTLSKLTSGTKQLTAIWKTVSGATGYEVAYSTSSKFTSKTTKKVTIKKAKTTKTTVKKLKKGKKYYVKVRAYKTVDGKKIYGAWSAVKSVKVK